MSGAEKQLLDLLKTIKGSGSFAVSGAKKLTMPGLHIAGIGEIGLPVNAVQAKAMIKMAKKAPFGKGAKTITNTAVRSGWEIDPDRLSFKSADWEKYLNKITRDVKKGLGVDDPSVTASLYKLLIYEKGDFFLPHKDSEKEKGMFGTLVVCLPSEHTGGELIIRFDGRTEIVDFSKAASSYKITYAAFFADCDHEIKPVLSGYRVCLVYNLLQAPKSKHNKEIWEILHPFLSSPTQQVFEYRKSEQYRSEMERAIRYQEMDLKMETIKKGTPHTLKITKTQAAYERALKEWKEDVALLKRLGG